MNSRNMNIFDVYREELERVVRERPTEYAYGVDNVPVVADRMIAAMQRGSYNKDGLAFKATCKRLGIKHTYTAINAAIKAAL